MKKIQALMLVSCLTLFLGACGDTGAVGSSAPPEEGKPEIVSSLADSTTFEPTETSEPPEKLFDSNEIVNSFLTKYNEIAEYPFGVDEIESGNVRNKAIISTGELYITIYGLDTDEGISISIEDQDEPSDRFFPVFRDSLKAIDKDVTDEQASKCWEELQSLEYTVDINDTGMETPYMVNKIQTGYIHSSIYGEISRVDVLYYTE